MLGKVVAFIHRTRFPKDVELLLANRIVYPIEAHVNGLGVFLFDRVLGEPMAGTVVNLEWCGWLLVAKFFESMMKGDRLTSIVECSCNFGFSSTGQDLPSNLAYNQNGTIVRWFGIIRHWSPGGVR